MQHYYPDHDQRNRRLLADYQDMAARLPHVTFAGRLAEYRYYDMAPTIPRAIQLARQMGE